MYIYIYIYTCMYNIYVYIHNLRLETLIELNIVIFELFELILLLQVFTKFPVEQFEAT